MRRFLWHPSSSCCSCWSHGPPVGAINGGQPDGDGIPDGRSWPGDHLLLRSAVRFPNDPHRRPLHDGWDSLTAARTT